MSRQRMPQPIVWACLVCCVLLCLPAKALDPKRFLVQLHHTAWDETSGITGHVFAIAQTNDGFLWIGTSVGLFRFDGILFEQYQLPPGNVAIAEARALLATSDGGLWVGYQTGVAFLKDGKADVYTEKQGLPYGRVRCLVRTKDGSIWASVVGGFSRLQDGRWKTIRADWEYPEKTAENLFVDRDDTLWVATGPGVMYLPSGETKFHDTTFKISRVSSIRQGADGTLWFADPYHDQILPWHSPLEKSEAKSWRIPIGAWSFLFDHEGSLWTAGDDVNRLTTEIMTDSILLAASNGKTADAFRRQDGLSDSYATALFEDREGNIWVGTNTGLDRFRNRSAMPVELSERTFTLIRGSGGDVWVPPGQLNKPFTRVQDHRPLTVLSQPLSASFMDSDGTFWFATGKLPGKSDETLWRVRRGKAVKVPGPAGIPSPYVKGILSDGKGTHWFAVSGHGEYTLRDNIWKRVAILTGKDADLSPDAQFMDGQGRMWLLYYARQKVAVIDGEHTTFFESSHGIDIGAPLVGAARGSQVWVAGTNALGFFNGKRFLNIRGINANAFAGVQAIIVTEKDGVWLKASEGVIQIAQAEVDKVMHGEGFAVRYRVFDWGTDFTSPLSRSVALPIGSDAIEAGDGKLWFLTKGGAATIDPHHLFKNDLPPLVAIRSVRTADMVYPYSSNLTLPKATKNLSIDYTALSLTFPERNQFRYQLVGFDKDWQEAKDRRQAFYTNLPPGSYTFIVVASNNDGVWNTVGARVAFTIPPTFLQSVWFRILCFVAGSLVLMLLFMWRMRQVENNAREHLSERLLERERIARELHDTLLQGFQGLILRFQAATLMMPSDGTPRTMIESALNRADDVMTEGRNRVRDLRNNESETFTLAERLKTASDELRLNKLSKFTITTQGTPLRLHRLVCEEAYWIGREALANAFLHSKCTSIASQLIFTKDQLILRVKDDGIGISSEIIRVGKPGHFGMNGMNERANKIGSVLQVCSPAAGGTEIELRIPARIAYANESKKTLLQFFRHTLSGKL